MPNYVVGARATTAMQIGLALLLTRYRPLQEEHGVSATGTDEVDLGRLSPGDRIMYAGREWVVMTDPLRVVRIGPPDAKHANQVRPESLWKVSIRTPDGREGTEIVGGTVKLLRSAPASNARPKDVFRVEKETYEGHDFVRVYLPSGSTLRLAPEEARELYAALRWVQ